MVQELEEWKSSDVNLVPFYNELRYATRHVLDAVSPMRENGTGDDECAFDESVFDSNKMRAYWDPLYTRNNVFVGMENLPRFEDDNWDKAKRHLLRIHYDIPEIQFWIVKEAYEQQKALFSGLELHLYRFHSEMPSLKEEAIRQNLGNLSNPLPLNRIDIRYFLKQMRATAIFAELTDKLYCAHTDEQVKLAEDAERRREKRNVYRTVFCSVLGLIVSLAEKWSEIYAFILSLPLK